MSFYGVVTLEKRMLDYADTLVILVECETDFINLKPSMVVDMIKNTRTITEEIEGSRMICQYGDYSITLQNISAINEVEFDVMKKYIDVYRLADDDTAGSVDYINRVPGGDYGSNPMGDGMWLMVPSGDVVGRQERDRRLPPVDMDNRHSTLIGSKTALQVKAMQGGGLR